MMEIKVVNSRARGLRISQLVMVTMSLLIAKWETEDKKESFQLHFVIYCYIIRKSKERNGSHRNYNILTIWTGLSNIYLYNTPW